MAKYIIQDVKSEYYQMFKKEIAYKEEERLLQKIYSYLPHVEIYKVKKLRNPYLYTSFLLKKMELEDCEVVELIHATAACNVPSIASGNLNWRFVERAKYGYGVSFSPNADYADFHSSNGGGNERAFIICDVLIRKKKKVSDNKHRCPMRPQFDTYVSQNGFVYLKFDDFTFYPKYALYYDRPPKQLSCFHRRR